MAGTCPSLRDVLETLTSLGDFLNYRASIADTPQCPRNRNSRWRVEDRRFRGGAIEQLNTPIQRPTMRIAQQLLVILSLTACMGGCSLLPTDMLLVEPKRENPLTLQPSGSTDLYDALARAKSCNAVVLQVIGVEGPARVIPLPADGRAVFVSDLLRQSGLTDEFPRMKATLYRNSQDAMGGIRMGVRFLGQTNQITPEHDYSLQAGDRLEVMELEINPLESLGNLLSPSGGRRIIFR